LQLFLNHPGFCPRDIGSCIALANFLPRNFGGQSLRAGGATRLPSLGTDPAIIQATGRWSSDTWKIYIRQHPLLLRDPVKSASTLFPYTPHITSPFIFPPFSFLPFPSSFLWQQQKNKNKK
jgi:hypothetical protein